MKLDQLKSPEEFKQKTDELDVSREVSLFYNDIKDVLMGSDEPEYIELEIVLSGLTEVHAKPTERAIAKEMAASASRYRLGSTICCFS